MPTNKPMNKATFLACQALQKSIEAESLEDAIRKEVQADGWNYRYWRSLGLYSEHIQVPNSLKAYKNTLVIGGLK